MPHCSLPGRMAGWIAGALAGAASTGVMTLLELAVRSQWGAESLLDWRINQATVARLTRRPPDRVMLGGLAMHLSHGLVAGVAFALILPVFPRSFPVVVLGLGYGVVLFVLTLAVVRLVIGRVRESRAVAVVLVTHLVYGAVLAYLLMWF